MALVRDVLIVESVRAGTSAQRRRGLASGSLLSNTSPGKNGNRGVLLSTKIVSGVPRGLGPELSSDLLHLN